MGGHMGDARVTVKNLEVVSVDPEKNLIALKGAVPGARGGLVLIKTTSAQTIWQV
jgi:large subunit ribosomal protein L3